MDVCSKLFLGTAMLAITAAAASAQTKPAGDKDDQFVITGCVTRSTDATRTTEPHSMMVWSKGDIYLAGPSARVKPSESARASPGSADAVRY